MALCAGTVGIPKGLEDNIPCWKRANSWKLVLGTGISGYRMSSN